MKWLIENQNSQNTRCSVPVASHREQCSELFAPVTNPETVPHSNPLLRALSDRLVSYMESYCASDRSYETGSYAAMRVD